VAFCEIDKYARQSYKAMYDTTNEEELHDITQWTDGHIRQFVRDRGHIDCITGGFPCQSFSIAGKRGGFADTRGTLFFEIMRIADIVRPRYLFLENVKGLLNHDGGATFETILNTLDEFGYDAEWQVLNSKNFGVPQNRERVFIIGHLRGTGGRAVFPIVGKNKEVNENYIKPVNDSKKVRDQFKYDSINRFYDPIGISPCLDTMGGGNREPKIIQPVLTPDRIEKRQNGRRFKEDGEPMFTLTSQDRHGIAIREATKKGYTVAEPGDSVNISFPDSETRRGRVGKQVANTLEASGVNQGVVIKNEEIDVVGNIYKSQGQAGKVYTTNGLSPTVQGQRTNSQGWIVEDSRIRKLTPLECWRLQGFTDEQFYKAKNDGVS